MASYPHVIRLRGPWDYQPLARLSPGPDGALVETAAVLPPAGRVTPPVDWGSSLGADFRGCVRFTRRFNRPTGLEPHERVWLVIEGVDARGSYSLDGHPLGSIDGYALPAASDITDLLAPSSVVGIEVHLDGADSSGTLHVSETSLPLGPLTPGPSPARGEGDNAGSSALGAGRELTGRDALRPGREMLPGGLIGEVRLEIRTHTSIDDLVMYWKAGAPPRLCIAGRVQSSQPVERLALVVSACEREVAFAEVATNAAFEIEVPVDDWPTWPDRLDEPVLTPVEIRLSGEGRALWQTVRETAPPTSDGESPRRAMLARALGTEPLAWSDYLAESDPAFEQLLETAGAVIGLRGILTEAAYRALDRANVGIVQHVPTAWATSVCTRLAHHPSILAWATTEEELAAPPAASQRNTYGRPWIAARKP